jgi:hypothetical protein
MSTPEQCSDTRDEADAQAARVLLMVSKTSPLYSQSWASTDKILPAALDALRSSRLIEQDTMDIPKRFLMKQRERIRDFIMFDIFNNSYNPALGHLPKNNLPVLVVHFSKDKAYARIAEDGLQKRVNKEIRDAHNRNGIGSIPPFVLDYTTQEAPIYMNPRDPSLL